MRRWAPRLFPTCLLLLLGAVLGHAAEHDGWFNGLFHCHAAEACHADDAPCDDAACHSHDEAAPGFALPSTASPSLDLARAAPDFHVIGLIPSLGQSLKSCLPDPLPPLPGEATWAAGRFPLLA